MLEAPSREIKLEPLMLPAYQCERHRLQHCPSAGRAGGGAKHSQIHVAMPAVLGTSLARGALALRAHMRRPLKVVDWRAKCVQSVRPRRGAVGNWRPFSGPDFAAAYKVFYIPGGRKAAAILSMFSVSVRFPNRYVVGCGPANPPRDFPTKPLTPTERAGTSQPPSNCG